MNKYKCEKCNLAVIIIDGEKPIKACNCEAPIIAEMEAVAHGKGDLNV